MLHAIASLSVCVNVVVAAVQQLLSPLNIIYMLLWFGFFTVDQHVIAARDFCMFKSYKFKFLAQN